MKLLQSTAENISQAAIIAQQNRTELYKLLNRRHLSAEAFSHYKLVNLVT